MFKFQEVVVFFPVLPVFVWFPGCRFWRPGRVFFQGSEGFGGTLVGDVTCRNLFSNVKSILHDVPLIYYATCLLMLLMMLGLCVKSMDYTCILGSYNVIDISCKAGMPNYQVVSLSEWTSTHYIPV